MKIAILMANTDESGFAQSRPKDGEKWRTLLSPLRPDWETVVFSVKDGEFPEVLDGIDGLIVTGSPASVHDGEAWIDQLLDLLREATNDSIPVFGACFGHQAITVALGGQVGRNPGGWAFGVEDIALKAPRFWMEEPGASIKQNAAHIEQVTKLPGDAEVYMGNPSCPVGGFTIGNRIFTSQYHPEITPDFMGDLINELADQKPPETISNARASLRETPDNARFAGWIVAFFEQAQNKAG